MKGFNNLIKIIFGSVATILFGAIGSGVWERVLSPFLTYSANRITSTVSSLSTRYSDSIYYRASNLHGSNSSITSLLILFIVFFALFIYALNSKKQHKLIFHLCEGITFQTKGWLGILFTGSNLVILVFIISTEATVHQIRKYSTKQMEIIRPYIGDANYLYLRSDYLRIKTKHDFEQFLNKLYSAASTKGVTIDKYEPGKN